MANGTPSPPVCAWADCDRSDIFARGLCRRCNMRARRAGLLEFFVAPDLVCEHCQRPYPNGTRSGFQYCSQTCQDAARMARNAENRAVALAGRACRLCFGPIPLSARSDAGHCSVVCQQMSWYLANQEHCLQRQAAWNAEHAEEKRAASSDWYTRNRERAAALTRRWRAENPDLVRKISRQAAHVRRARKRGASTVEKIDLVEIWERDQGICWLCETSIDVDLSWPHPMSQSLDHVVPLAKGGDHSRANVALAHLVCNLRKGAKLPSAA
jgi:5-methylcytosine-specific restriction endonuclease McrA